MKTYNVVGFTGTREGMQLAQFGAMRNLLLGWDVAQFHHGDCVGADKEAHHMFREVFPKCVIIVHPPLETKNQAHCEGDVLLAPKEYIERDYDIVDISHVMIATPKKMTEERRSGTWTTVRYAKKKGKELYTICPDGSIEHFVVGVLQ